MMKRLRYLLSFLCLTLACFPQLTYTNVSLPGNFNAFPTLGITCSYYDPASKTLYVGGGFTTIGSSTRNRIAAIDANTGVVKAWSPVINNGTVYSIKKSGNLIYAAGDFTMVNGSPANCLVALSETTGNTVDVFPFTPGEAVYDFDINGNSLAAGGALSIYNGSPVLNQLVVIDRFTHSQTINPINSVFAGHRLGKVNKLQYINNDVYICGNDSIADMDNHSIFKLNTATSNLILYLAAWNSPGYLSIDDFSFDKGNNMLYLTGDFVSLDIFNNALYTGFGNTFFYALKIDLTTNTIQNWQPLSFVWPFIPTSGAAGCTVGGPYVPSHDLYTYKILSVSYGIFVSRGVGRYIHVYDKSSGALIDSLGWTNSVLFQNYPTPGKPYQRFLDFESNGDKLFVMTNFPATPTNQCFSLDAKFYEFCLPPENLSSPVEITGKATFCKGQTYKFTELLGKEVENFQWSYTGTGATVSGNGNDTIDIAFSYSATPGQLQVYGITACGKITNTVSLNVPFFPIPNVFAGQDTSLNCYNNKNVIISASSSNLNPHSFNWTGPISPVTNYSLITNVPGTYYATTYDSVTTCTNTDALIIVYDTLKPNINTPSSYTVGCSSSTITLSATGSLPQDSIWWFIGANYPNPAIYSVSSSTTIATVYNKGKSNGCLNSKTVTIYFNSTPPTFTIASSLFTPTVGLPEFLPITCSNDSVYLDASAGPSCKIHWKLPMSTVTVTDPYYAQTQGIYQLIVSDTVSGCNNTSFFGQILLDQTAPNLIMPSTVPNINCSFNTATLIASSSTPGTSIQWTAPSIPYSGSNPSIVNQTAWYCATVTNTVNGCTRKDSLLLTQQPILILNKSSDSTICNGASVQLSVSPVGGTPGFIFNWNSGLPGIFNPLVSPTVTTKYVITVNDGGGCIGTDTIKITVPPLLSDSILTFSSCDPLIPGGQIQVYGVGGVSPYQFSIDGGTNFQASGVFTNQSYGTYSVLIKDALSCTHSATTVVSASSSAPSPDFIVNTSMMKGDTFVVVDISNPRPDSVHWVFPSPIQIIDNSNPFSPIVVCTDTGSYSIKLDAFFGSCQTSLTKIVHLVKFDSSYANAVNGNKIVSLDLFPNPNSGQFTVNVILSKKQSFVLIIYDASATEILRFPVYESSSASIPVSMPITTPGTYFLKVVAEYDSKQKVFVVSQ